jgi:hypothetical protein
MTSFSDPIAGGAIDPRKGAGAVPAPPRPAPRRSAGRQRAWFRAVHVVAGLFLGTYVYAPAAVTQPLHLALQVGLVPAAVLSGLVLWKQAQIRRLLSRRTSTR